jgi:O-antigen/teichoic acid export membrane protein
MAINSVGKVVGNFTSLLTSEVVNRATTFVLYALVARYLGAFEFGQLSLALTLFFIFAVLAGAGLRTLITREVARDRAKTDQYLINGSAIVVACSLLSMIALVFFVRLMSYSRETASVILLVSVGVLPFSLSTINKAVFQGWERMHYIAWANVPVHVAKVGLAFLLLRQGYGLFALILLLLASHLAILVLEWWLMLWHITRPRMGIDRRFCMAMARSTTPFLGMTGIVAINTSLDLILLSRFADEAQVGLLNAAVQLITPLTVVYETSMLSVFPEMCRQFATGLEGLKRISGHMLELLLAIALPVMIGVLFLAEPVLLLLYGDADFVLASQALRILAWTLILTAFTNVLGRTLVASLREKVTLRIVVTSTLTKLLLGLILISQFGLMGAVVVMLLTALVEAILHYVSVSRLLFQLPLGRLAWKPVAAGTCIAVYLALVQVQGFLLSAVSAGAVYAVLLLALVIWSNGGPRQSKAKYQYLWSKQRL